MSKLRDHASGKWELIITELLGEEFTNTRRHQPCPRGQGTDCYRFSGETGPSRGGFFCKCSGGESDGFELLQCVNGWTFAEAAEAVEGVIGKPDGPREQPPKPHWIFDYFREAELPKRSRYLEARAVAPVAPLRFHRAVPYYHEKELLGNFPAMLAPVYHGKKLRGVHTTYLNGDQKADLPAPRKMYSHLSVREGFIPLGGSGPTIAVAEGIETALSVMRLTGNEHPCWSCLNTSLMKNFTPPAGTERVVICGDNDKSFGGQAAAYHLAHRLTAQGVDVAVSFPGDVGMDWNDVLIDALRRTAA